MFGHLFMENTLKGQKDPLFELRSSVMDLEHENWSQNLSLENEVHDLKMELDSNSEDCKEMNFGPPQTWS